MASASEPSALRQTLLCQALEHCCLGLSSRNVRLILVGILLPEGCLFQHYLGPWISLKRYAETILQEVSL